AVEIVEITEIDHANGDREHDAAVEQFEKKPLVAAQRFSKHGEIEVIVAARRCGYASKYAVDKEAHHRFLGPEQRTDQGAGDDVGKHDDGKPGDRDTAQDHQEVLERIECAPFQMALVLQHQLVEPLHR